MNWWEVGTFCIVIQLRFLHTWLRLSLILQIKPYFGGGCPSVLFLGTLWSISHCHRPWEPKCSDGHSVPVFYYANCAYFVLDGQVLPPHCYHTGIPLFPLKWGRPILLQSSPTSISGVQRTAGTRTFMDSGAPFTKAFLGLLGCTVGVGWAGCT